MSCYLAAWQRAISTLLGDRIIDFAHDSGWLSLIVILPMGIAFGAAYASTPGHGKAVLAAYVAGTRSAKCGRC